MGEIMGKKGLIWAAIAAMVLLGVLLLFSIPVRPRVSDNRHFGFVKDVYTFSGDGLLPVELEGDTDVFPSAEVSLSLENSYSAPEIFDFDTRTYVPFSEIRMTVRIETTLHQDLMLTRAHYIRGMVGYGSTDFPHRGGSIERRGEDGEWELLRELRETVVYPDEETGTVTLSYILPASASGEYRFTYYFRTYTRGYSVYGEPYDPDTFSTGEELYTVSYTVDIPEPRRIEPSGKPLDLLCFTLDYNGYDHSYYETALLVNGIDLPYIRSYDTRLQYLDGGVWRDVKCDGPLARQTRMSLAHSGATVYDPDGESVRCYRVTGHLCTPERGSYRLVLSFSEKERGQGDQYPLTIYFDIPEEATR